MSYQIRKSDGTLLLNLPDGQVNQNVSSLTLIGKNVSNFGESLNNNLLHMLENFASNVQPTSPVIGQLWFNKTNNKLMVYDNSLSFKETGTSGNLTIFTTPGHINITADYNNSTLLFKNQGQVFTVTFKNSANTSFPVGGIIKILQADFTSIIFSTDVGVTIMGPTILSSDTDRYTINHTQASECTARYIGDNIWVLTGEVN